MLTKDDIEVSTLRVMDRLERMDRKIDQLINSGSLNDSRVFYSSDVKRMLGISDSTLWRYGKKGLKSYKSVTGHRVYHYDDLMAFIKGV